MANAGTTIAPTRRADCKAASTLQTHHHAKLACELGHTAQAVREILPAHR